MNLLKNQIRKRLSKFKSLLLSGRLYFRFSLIALGLVFLILIILSDTHRSIYFVGLETMLLFIVIYSVLLLVVILSISPYKQESNLFAGIIPALMTLVGLIIAIYFRSVYLDPSCGAIFLILPILTILILPISVTLFSRSTGIKAWKLYISSLVLIILVVWIAWSFFSGS